MALRKCGECGREISSWAKQCPHCGGPTPVQNVATLIAFIGCLPFIIIAFIIMVVLFG